MVKQTIVKHTINFTQPTLSEAQYAKAQQRQTEREIVQQEGEEANICPS